jgi:hypothetical protein
MPHPLAETLRALADEIELAASRPGGPLTESAVEAALVAWYGTGDWPQRMGVAAQADKIRTAMRRAILASDRVRSRITDQATRPLDPSPIVPQGGG